MNKGFLVLLTGLVTACGADSNPDPQSNEAVNGDKAKAAFEEAFDRFKWEEQTSPASTVRSLAVQERMPGLSLNTRYNAMWKTAKTQPILRRVTLCP